MDYRSQTILMTPSAGIAQLPWRVRIRMKKIVSTFTILAWAVSVGAANSHSSATKSQFDSCSEPGTDFCEGCSVSCKPGEHAYCAPAIDDEAGNCEVVTCACKEKARCFCE
jgi:hypothetical protein